MLPVHPEFTANGSFKHLKLGRGPVKKDPRQLMLAKYVDVAALPAAPDTFDISPAVKGWPMYGNDQLGDCTCAAVGHMIEAWSANATTQRTPDQNTIEQLYWLTGTPPANSGQAGGPNDDGRVEIDILNYWRKTGVGGDLIHAYVGVEPGAHEHVKAGAWLCGGLYIGVSLPITAQGKPEWDVVGDGKTGDSAPGSWGGHAIDVVAYDKDRLTIITWGAPLRMTWAFWDAYVDEAYAIISPDWFTAAGITTGGLDLATLDADLEALDAVNEAA